MPHSSLITHHYYLSWATGWSLNAFARAASYFKTKALQDLALPHPERLSSKEKRRLKHYFYGTTYLSVIFCALRGHARDAQEKHLYTNLAALAYFFDDLVDQYQKQQPEDDFAGRSPEQYGELADERRLAIHFLQNVYAALPPGDLEQFKDFMHRVFEVETAGKQNKGQVLDEAGLRAVTAQKGGFSVLMFRRVLAHPLSEQEQEALYKVGSLIQLCDDIFDIWFDRQEGVQTLGTFYAEKADINRLEQLFEQQVDQCYTGLQGLKTVYGRHQSGIALRVLHFLVSITRVCLQHYTDLQKKHGTLPLDNRQVMVVDMERWGNRIRAARELLRAPNTN